MPRSMILTFVAEALLLVGPTGEISAQARTPVDTQVAVQWKAVKERYPGVALQFLRQQAAAYELSKIAIAQEAARPFVLQRVCGLLWYYKLSWPQECDVINANPSGDIGDCFRPQPSGTNHQYEMPSVEEAEGCVQAALKPR